MFTDPLFPDEFNAPAGESYSIRHFEGSNPSIYEIAHAILADLIQERFQYDAHLPQDERMSDIETEIRLENDVFGIRISIEMAKAVIDDNNIIATAQQMINMIDGSDMSPKDKAEAKKEHQRAIDETMPRLKRRKTYIDAYIRYFFLEKAKLSNAELREIWEAEQAAIVESFEIKRKGDGTSDKTDES